MPCAYHNLTHDLPGGQGRFVKCPALLRQESGESKGRGASVGVAMSPMAIQNLIEMFGIEKGLCILNMYTAMDDVEVVRRQPSRLVRDFSGRCLEAMRAVQEVE